MDFTMPTLAIKREVLRTEVEYRAGTPLYLKIQFHNGSWWCASQGVNSDITAPSKQAQDRTRLFFLRGVQSSLNVLQVAVAGPAFFQLTQENNLRTATRSFPWSITDIFQLGTMAELNAQYSAGYRVHSAYDPFWLMASASC